MISALIQWGVNTTFTGIHFYVAHSHKCSLNLKVAQHWWEGGMFSSQKSILFSHYVSPPQQLFIHLTVPDDVLIWNWLSCASDHPQNMFLCFGKGWDLYSYKSTSIQLFLVLIIVCFIKRAVFTSKALMLELMAESLQPEIAQLIRCKNYSSKDLPPVAAPNHIGLESKICESLNYFRYT